MHSRSYFMWDTILGHFIKNPSVKNTWYYLHRSPGVWFRSFHPVDTWLKRPESTWQIWSNQIISFSGERNFFASYLCTKLYYFHFYWPIQCCILHWRLIKERKCTYKSDSLYVYFHLETDLRKLFRTFSKNNFLYIIIDLNSPRVVPARQHIYTILSHTTSFTTRLQHEKRCRIWNHVLKPRVVRRVACEQIVPCRSVFTRNLRHATGHYIAVSC